MGRTSRWVTPGAGPAGPLRRIARRIGWDRNPLRRTSDRYEAGLTALLVTVFLLLGPWVGWRVAQASYRAEVQAVAWERQHRHAVQAVLLRDAVWQPPVGQEPVIAPESVPVRARWTAPDGTVHTGPVLAGVGVRAGSTVRVWTDQHGAVTAAPGERSPGVRAFLAGLLTVVNLAAVLGAVRLLVRWHLQRRRVRSWQAEWDVVEPRWSGRRR